MVESDLTIVVSINIAARPTIISHVTQDKKPVSWRQIAKQPIHPPIQDIPLRLTKRQTV